MDGISSSRTHRIPNLLFHKFSTMFPTESKGLSNEKTNLLISYVLVLTLFVDEFETDLTDIAKDLRMSAIALRKHYENLGCKLVRKRNVMFATLPVPLQFPQLRQRRQKRNRWMLCLFFGLFDSIWKEFGLFLQAYKVRFRCRFTKVP